VGIVDRVGVYLHHYCRQLNARLLLLLSPLVKKLLNLSNCLNPCSATSFHDLLDSYQCTASQVPRN